MFYLFIKTLWIMYNVLCIAVHTSSDELEASHIKCSGLS